MYIARACARVGSGACIDVRERVARGEEPQRSCAPQLRSAPWAPPGERGKEKEGRAQLLYSKVSADGFTFSAFRRPPSSCARGGIDNRVSTLGRDVPQNAEASQSRLDAMTGRPPDLPCFEISPPLRFGFAPDRARIIQGQYRVKDELVRRAAAAEEQARGPIILAGVENADLTRIYRILRQAQDQAARRNTNGPTRRPAG